jgi:SAM-dependent methyltransferase
MDIACNLCGSGQYTVVFPEKRAQVHRIVRCTHCGLMFASPRQTSDIDEIESWIPEEVYQITKRQESDRIEKQTLQRRDYQTTRAYLAARHPGRGLLVEVGSSLGYLLDFFRQDKWTVLGVEPNGGFALYAERELAVKTLPTTLGGASLAPGSVDVVLMMHVIEHVPDPMVVMREVRDVMKPGGTFVLETPSYDSLAFSLLRHRERSVSCDGHIYFFTRATLEQLAVKAGFRVLRADYVGRSMTLARLLYNVGVMSKSRTIASGLRRLSQALRLNRVPLYLNARDMVRMYLEPA